MSALLSKRQCSSSTSANLQSAQVMKYTVYKFHLKNVFITYMKIIPIKVINPIAFTFSSWMYFTNEKACSLNIFILNSAS